MKILHHFLCIQKQKPFYLYTCSSDPWQYEANFLSFAFTSRGQGLWLVGKSSQPAKHYLDVTGLIIELFFFNYNFISGECLFMVLRKPIWIPDTEVVDKKIVNSENFTAAKSVCKLDVL